MVLSIRCWFALVVPMVLLGNSYAADDPLPRVEIGKIGKAATALVEIKPRRSYGSAFCIHPSGLFLTNEHLAQGEITLVLNPGLKNEKAYRAKVVRSSKEADLALLRIEGVKDLPVLVLGSDRNLTELMEVVACGFPLGMALAPNPKEYPTASVNAGGITRLLQKQGQLDGIQVDLALYPGNSGGPLLDNRGKVVGVVRAGVLGTAVNFAIPVNVVETFLARPDVQFDPPNLTPANVYSPVNFEAKVLPLLPSEKPFTVELILKPGEGREQSHRMQLDGDMYRVSAIPLPQPSGKVVIRLLAQFDNGVLNALTADREFKIGEKALRLSQVRSLQFKPQPHAVLHEGKAVDGPISGLSAVPMQLGDQTLPVDLNKAVQLTAAVATELDEIWYTLLVRQEEKEIYRQTDRLLVDGFHPSATSSLSLRGIKPPILQENPTVRKLPAPAVDLAVGGAGRYLILHLADLHKLAIFDVSIADIVGYVPVKEEKCLFTAGLKDVVLFLPTAGTIERWNLRTLEREAVATMPIKGVVKSMAMGAASRGPLLVHWAAGTQALDRASFTLVDVETMKIIENEIKVYPALGSSYRDTIHLRASANGKVFGIWCTSHSPSGVGVIVPGAGKSEAYYGHWSAGHVVPGPDGTTLFTAAGSTTPQQSMASTPQPQGDPVLPACHGDYYLSWSVHSQPGQPQAGPTDPITIRFPGKDKPIATFTDLNLPTLREDWIKNDFTIDKRIQLIPEARMVVAIPASNDRLVLHAYGR